VPPRPPSGIPKTFLRKATTDEEKQRAMRTATGEYVVMQTPKTPFDFGTTSVQYMETENDKQQHDTDDDDMYYYENENKME
jgi:hypothetical protein